MLRGALAAAVTPLAGDRLDEEAVPPYVEFLAAAGLDGLLALGTTGEGILFGVDERRRAVESFVTASAGRLQVAAHCGAQTTADTVALAAHAAEAGADAVAVIGPPYFQLDESRPARALRRGGSRVRAAAVLRLRVRARERLRRPARRDRGVARAGAEPRRSEGLRRAVRPLLAVSDRRARRVRRPRVADLRRALEAGAAGAVSGLAAAFPDRVAAVVRDADGRRGSRRSGSCARRSSASRGTPP